MTLSKFLAWMRRRDKTCDLCCCAGKLENTHGMIICEHCMDEIAYIDDRDRIWRWAAGQYGDECYECGKDLSDAGSILMNTETAYVLMACIACIDP